MTDEQKARIDSLEVLLDNGGGIVVQCEGYAHSYDIPRMAAEAVRWLLRGEDPSDWEGNEEWLDWTDEQVRNGGYRVYAGVDLQTRIAPPANAWRNEHDFLVALHGPFNTPFQATHRIRLDNGVIYDVMLDEGRAYTEDEWEQMADADFERQDNGDWTFQGQPFAGTVEANENLPDRS